MVSRWDLELISGFSLSVVSISLGGLSWYLMMLNCSVLWEWSIWSSSSKEFIFVMFFDWISTLFFSLVSLISAAVIIYSKDYMKGDEVKERFTYLVLVFVFSMFFMVFSLNLVSIMLGWDGLGVISYILVIHYQNEKSSASGMITALSNRIGDAALLLSIGLMVDCGSWNFMEIDPMEKKFPVMMMILIVLAASTKSAQIPFSAWLPAAMAAPTPVSALVHSSTLVTAGVYLLIRFTPFICEGVAKSLTFLGLLTMLMASSSANWETDLKKIIALSTLSQLGIMVVTVSLSLPMLAFFHLLTHAMFKALLFLCGGKVIHEAGSIQDLRFMGGMSESLPFTLMCMNISNLALCGFPFMAGFYSKDLLVEGGLFKGVGLSFIVLMSIGVGLSAAYSIRLLYFSFLTSICYSSTISFNDLSEIMMFAKLVLVGLSIISGAILSDWLFPDPVMLSLPFWMKIFALLSTTVGFMFGILISLSEGMKLIVKFISLSKRVWMSMWILPLLSGKYSSLVGAKLVDSMILMEDSWFELLAGQGMYLLSLKSGKKVLDLQFNSLIFYFTVFGVMLVFSISWFY